MFGLINQVGHVFGTVSANELLNTIYCTATLILAFVGVAALIIGKSIGNELQLRGVDAICGYHAILRANLINLKAVTKTTSREVNAQSSVFSLFCTKTLKDDLAFRENNYELEKKNSEFMPLVENLVGLFRQSQGQIPLSRRMHKYLDDMYATLIEIIYADRSNRPLKLYTYVYIRENHLENGKYSDDRLDSEDKVIEKSKIFNDLIDNIIREIDEKMPILLKKFWKRTKRRKIFKS